MFHGRHVLAASTNQRKHFCFMKIYTWIAGVYIYHQQKIVLIRIAEIKIYYNFSLSYLNVTLSATDTEGFCNADIAAPVFLKQGNSYQVK